MKNVFFYPWIGENFTTGGIFGKRILVLGEAHLCGGCSTCGKRYKDYCEDLQTIPILENYLAYHSGTWSRTFRKFERALVGYYTNNDQSRIIWHSLAFYNYIQVALPKARMSPTDEDFADGAIPFFEVIKSLNPELIIAWGKTRMFYGMPNVNWARKPDIQTENIKAYSGTYTLDDETEVNIIWINHPSSPFSWKKWYEVLKLIIN